MIRTVALLLFFAQAGLCQARPQELFQQEVKKEDLKEASRQVGIFLDAERSFPKRYAVKSEFDLSVRSIRTSRETTGTQWIAFDDRSNRWISDTTFKNVEGTKVEVSRAQCFFNQGSFSIKEAIDFGEDWQVANLDNIALPIFHPRFVWATSACNLTYSFRTTSIDLLGDKDCVGVAGLGKLNGSYWARKQHRGVNPISGVFFDPANALVHAKLLPAIEGNFDAEALKKIQESSGFQLDVDLRWKTIDNQVKVLERLDSREANAAGDVIHLKIKSVWLVGDRVGDEYFIDPRLAPTPSLRDLKFKD